MFVFCRCQAGVRVEGGRRVSEIRQTALEPGASGRTGESTRGTTVAAGIRIKKRIGCIECLCSNRQGLRVRLKNGVIALDKVRVLALPSLGLLPFLWWT